MQIAMRCHQDMWNTQFRNPSKNKLERSQEYKIITPLGVDDMAE